MTRRTDIDGSFHDYYDRLRLACDPQVRHQAALTAEPSPKYRDGQPLKYPGITLLTPPDSQEPVHDTCYTQLTMSQSRICDAYSDSLSPTNAASFHITGADLFSGSQYRDLKAGRPDLDRYIADILMGLDWTSRTRQSPKPNWRFHGLAVFKHAVVALFAPAGRQSYADLTALRDEIYTAPRLARLGLKRPLPLMVHLTLAYFRAPISKARVDHFNRLFAEESNRLFAAGIEHPISTLALTRFEQMGAFFETGAAMRFQF